MSAPSPASFRRPTSTSSSAAPASRWSNSGKSMQVRGKRAFGQLGEDKACAFLQAQGHRIVARNWRGSHLEVDIISEAS
ncbi:MAG: YraN family protein, partial [Erysipelotrichales bacterium]|nr:YraN family protein [Erysipelotrichales bacterium]